MREKTSKLKKSIFLLIATVLLSSPFLALAQPKGINNQGIVGFLERLGAVIGTATVVVSGLALLLFIWGLVKFIMSGGGAEGGDTKGKTDGKKTMFWGIIALFVMVSIWGIVLTLQNTFGIDPNQRPYKPPIIDSSYFGPKS